MFLDGKAMKRERVSLKEEIIEPVSLKVRGKELISLGGVVYFDLTLFMWVGRRMSLNQNSTGRALSLNPH